MGKDLKGKEIGKGITQRKRGDYQARYVDRFGKRQSVYGKTLQETKIKLAQAIADNDRGLNVVDSNITLNEWFEQWFETVKKHRIKETSIAPMKKIVK